MPSASQKSSISLGELAMCEYFLDSHREYAIDLVSNIEKIQQWHGTDSCPEIREGKTCTVCELCSADGLLGATKMALVCYNDAAKHLQGVRASLKKSVPSREAPSPTLFKSRLAKAVFLSLITVGDTLRSQHATWQARLQSELATSPSSAQSPGHINTGHGDVDKNANGGMLLPTYSGPRFVDPEANSKFNEVSTGSVPEFTGTPGSSMLVVFRRCLSSDCPCEANRANAASNSNLKGTCGPQVASKVPRSPSDSKKTRTSKVTAKLGGATRGGGNHAARSTTTNLERRSRGASDSDGLAKTRTNAQIQKPSTVHDPDSPDARALDTQRPQDVVLAEHRPSSPISETALLTQETETPLSSPERIVDPRVFRLRAQIARSDEARRALMEWCRAWTADLQLDSQGRHGTGPEASPESTMKDTRKYLSALTRGLETVEPDKSLSLTGQR